MKYTAATDTLLKKQPIQGSELTDTQKVVVPAGKSYEVLKVLESTGLHIQIRLAHKAGDWWIFQPHWEAPTNLLSAVFRLNLRASNALIYGSLAFTDSFNQEVLRVVATSGASGYQYPGAHTVRGRGCIPPGNHWKISTHGYHLDTKGIEGMFYHITPDPYAGRSEIGLHRDANVPGSAGCIVVKDSNIFQTKVQPLIDKQQMAQDFINLWVIYS